jgi:hypothetical protein
VLFYDDTEDPYGVEQVDLHLRMPPAPKNIADQRAMEAYDTQVYELVRGIIRRVNGAGWRRYIEPSEARLAGRESYDKTWRTSPDPSYPFSFAEWQTVAASDLTWRWYHSGTVVRLSFTPGRERIVIDNLSLNVTAERLRLAIEDPESAGDDKAGAIRLAQIMPKVVAQRLEREAKARAAGIKILEDWVDPPIGGVAVPKH